MPSSGTSATTTNSDSAVTLVAAQSIGFRHVLIVNEGSVAGFWSKDGNEWHRLPADFFLILDYSHEHLRGPLQVKRTPGGTDLAGVYGSLF